MSDDKLAVVPVLPGNEKAVDEGQSLITKNTVVSGDINTTSPIKVCGEVKGGIVSTKSVEVSGRVTGDINGEKVILTDCQIQGNINSKTVVEVGPNVMMVGDVNAVDLNTSGRIKGKIEVTKLVTIEKTAVCEGSISASLINIKTGAKIKGPITVYEPDAPEFSDNKLKKPVEEKPVKKDIVEVKKEDPKVD